MKRRAIAILAVLSAAACRQTMQVDTSAAPFIPAPVAIDNLKKLLPTAATVGCTFPKETIFLQEEVKDWKVDAEAIVFQVEKRDPFRIALSEITETKADRMFGAFEVRMFLPPPPEFKKKAYYFVRFKDEAPARRVFELIETLRAKK